MKHFELKGLCDALELLYIRTPIRVDPHQFPLDIPISSYQIGPRSGHHVDDLSVWQPCGVVERHDATLHWVNVGAGVH